MYHDLETQRTLGQPQVEIKDQAKPKLKRRNEDSERK
jgi:hypothetical protein